MIEFGGENIKYPIIVDGQANFDVLELIDKDEVWLEQQINLQGYNQIKEIYLGNTYQVNLNFTDIQSKY